MQRIGTAIYIAIIALVGISGSGFLWYYTQQLHPISSGAFITRPQSQQILGVETGTNSGGPVVLSTGDEVTSLFLEYCLRAPTAEELTQWTGEDIAALREHLQFIQVVTERFNKRYVSGCVYSPVAE
ncbi:MAG: hypothetical protein PHY34_03520 [Patescibacteria group bacterium]|nr:hypothetical protein [Patescibacteria group bacterium]MDD5715648.1 hypothetical protein [Patescibacteria group bacterium]